MRAINLMRPMLLLALLSALAQAQVVVTDDANTSSLSPTKNFGGSIALIVCSGSNTYIKFSLANLGSAVTGSNVSKATLILYTDFVLTPGTMDVYQVSGSWTEGKITWNNAPALGTKLLSAVSVTNTGYLSLDMTTTVQAWLNGTLANNGIALVSSSGSSISVSFDSKENILTSHVAELNLVLVSAGPQGAQGPQGVQGPQGLAGAAGPQGAVGPAGPAGATGSAGPAGQPGPQGLMGLTGMTGATGAAGPVGPAGANGTGFNFRNTFDNSASYAVNDVVTFQGASYVATAANQGPNNPTPDQNSSAWSVMAAQGAAGAAGAQGPSGSAGPVGQQGPVGPVGPIGPRGPVGPMPIGAALTTTSNNFSGSQTVNGNLILGGSGAGVQFADGTFQATAASNSGGGGGASCYETSSVSPVVPSGYTPLGTVSAGNVWFSLAPMSTARVGLAAAALNGLIYAIGGGSNGNTVEAYNPSTNSWSSAAPMSTARSGLAAAALNGLIYAIGGFNLNTVEVYNPSTNSWSTAAPMPTTRQGLAAVAVNGLIYAIGGQTSSGITFNTVEVYNPSTNSWSTAAPMPTARYDLAAVAVNGLIYAIGGYNNDFLNTVEVYNPSTNSWSTAAPMPTARSGLAADAVNGLIYAIGGQASSGITFTVEVYNPSSNSWSTAAPMPTARSGLAAGDVNGLVYAIGGFFGSFVATSAAEQYSPPVTVYTFIKN